MSEPDKIQVSLPDGSVVRGDFPGPIDYDLTTLDTFLDAVTARVEKNDGSGTHDMLCWRTPAGQTPRLPRNRGGLMQTLMRHPKQPAALYYGTSLCHIDEQGVLRNRRAQFHSLFVVVLDDIGTKVPLDKLSGVLAEPTYVIETSQGNFQYGFVLETPITDYDHARLLVRMVYDSGLTDSGGAMPTKLVRLPGGVNGKAGAKGSFPVTLRELHPERLFTPQGLITAMGYDRDWNALCADPSDFIKRARTTRTSQWSATTPAQEALDGVIDPLLEWMQEEGLVLGDGDEWVTILCPWHDDHTTDDPSAGYSPIGRGDNGWEDTRGFRCFHEHCRDRRTPEFLQHMADQSGLALPMTDTSWRLFTSWAFDAAANKAAYIGPGDVRFRRGTLYQIAALKALHPAKRMAYVPGGKKVKQVSEVDLWLESPHRVIVEGMTGDPRSEQTVTDVDGTVRVNVWKAPGWGPPLPGDDDPQHPDVKCFTDYLDYLIPDEEERDYFLDWLSMKARDQGFRGAAIVMYTPVFGAGRSTLVEMIALLLGRDNVTTTEFRRLMQSQFNGYLRSPLVVVHEVQADEVQHYGNSFRRLREIVDLQPLKVSIEDKYVNSVQTVTHSSFIFLTNHGDAIPVPYGDRRFFICANTLTPRGVEPGDDFFVKLNRWIRDEDADPGDESWAGPVWRWLASRHIPDETRLFQPPPWTNTKAEMSRTGRHIIERFADAFMAHWSGPVITSYAFREVVTRLAEPLGLPAPNTLVRLADRVFADRTTLTDLSYLGKDTRVRLYQHMAPPSWSIGKRPVQSALRRKLRLTPADQGELEVILNEETPRDDLRDAMCERNNLDELTDIIANELRGD